MGGMYLCAVSVDDSKAILYVPPVAIQLAALPAEAILVRGCDQPAAEPSELLRAAREGEATVAEELVRAGKLQ